MATVLAEPDAAKAVISGTVPDMIHFGFPITKSEDTEQVNPVDGTPDLVIWGKVTDGTVDSDLQIVDPEASLRWIKTWYDTKANIRLGHDPKRPIGRGIDIDGHHVKALIADPTAKHLIRLKVLQDWSVGIMNPDIRKGDPRFRHLDPMGKAVNGVITDRDDGLTGLGEISAVDRGSNYGTAFQMVKAASGGTAEWVGEMVAPDDVLAKVASGGTLKAYKSVSVDLPASMRIKVSPAQLAKMNTMARRNALPAAAKAAGPFSPILPVPAETESPALKAVMATESAVWKRDIDTATRHRLAGEGRALPDLSYPIETHEDAGNAVTLALSGHGDASAAKALIRRIARKEGWQDILDRLKGKKAPEAAVPDVPKAMKCAKCMGKGMADGKPCTECPRGAKKARRMMAKAVAGLDGAAVPGAAKKKKVMCSTCGARQNVKHTHCPECGNPLHPGAIPVMKNHDFTCLGCGKTPLDKGEQHCPECGKENPGYLEVADRKLPMNAGKTAGEDRVPDLSVKAKAKKGKKKAGKKGKDGKKMPPWMKPDGDGGDGKDGAEKSAKPATVKRKKGKGNGRSPAAGAVSQSTEGLPGHREPDGAPVEAFEQDTHLTDGDHEMAASARHKSLRMDPDLAVLHDLTCPAFAPADVAKSLPAAEFASVDTGYWQSKALEAASGADFLTAQREWNELATLCRHALTLKTADLQVLHDLRTEHHAAFLDANKAFRDATPGPGSFPTPGHVTPGQFSRPYISAGHAAPSPQHDAPHSFGIPGEAPAGQDFHREYITAGHATDSPSNSTPRPMPQAAPAEAGRPSRVFYQNTMRDNARQALTAMHDHISRMFPDVCPMSPELSDVQKPAPAVPDPVGMTGPHRGKSAKAETGKAAKVKTVKQRKPARTGPALTALPLAEPAPLAGLTAAPDADVLKAAVTRATAKAVKAATAPLAKQLKTQAKVLDAIAGQRDTTGAPSRLSGLAKTATATSPAPAGPRTASESAEQAQTSKMRRLWDTWRTTSNPEFQEAAWLELQAMLGTQPMTGNDNGLIPMRRPFTT